MKPQGQSIGEAMKRKREEIGLSPRQVAEIADITGRMLNDIEFGTGNPTLIELQAVARALGCELVIVLKEKPRYDVTNGERWF